MGIPRIIACLEDRIFEGLTVEDSKGFPIQFLSAVPVGVDLEPVWRKYMIWLLADAETGVIRHAKKDETRKAIQDVADLLEKSLTEKITSGQFLEVRKAARAADDDDAAGQKRYKQMADKLIQLLSEAA